MATYTYDLTGDVGKLRFLIQDNDVSSVADPTPLNQRSAVFSDEELAYILTLETDIELAAARALRVWATNKNLLVQRRDNGQASLDLGSIRSDLLRAADAYEKQAYETPADGIAEQGWTQFTERRIIWNSYIRSEGA